MQEAIITSLIVAFISFTIALVIGDPIKSKFQEWKTRISIRRKDVVRIKVFFISCDICTDNLKLLLLNQNKIQSLFQFELSDWDMFDGRKQSVENLKNLRTDSKLEFCEAFQTEINKYYLSQNQPQTDVVNIVVTELPFPQNFYTWNTRDKRTIVIGVNSLSILFGKEAGVVDKIILRIIQRMAIYSRNIPDLKVHKETRGCLFDFTARLSDLQYSIDDVFICKECKNAILDNKSASYLEGLVQWVKKEQKKP